MSKTIVFQSMGTSANGTANMIVAARVKKMMQGTFECAGIGFEVSMHNYNGHVIGIRSLPIHNYPNVSVIASACLRVSSNNGGLWHSHDMKDVRLNKVHYWTTPLTSGQKVTIDIEFHELSIQPTGCLARIVLDGEIDFYRPLLPTVVNHSTAHVQNVMRDLNEKKILADIDLILGNGEPITVHRSVLAASSSAFYKMLGLENENDLSVDVTVTATVKLPNVYSDQAWRAFLNFLYGTLSDEDLWKNRHELLDMAHGYEVSALFDTCSHSMDIDISTRNVLDRLATAHQLQIKSLKDSCLNYLSEFGRIQDIGPEKFKQFYSQACEDIKEELRKRFKDNREISQLLQNA